MVRPVENFPRPRIANSPVFRVVAVVVDPGSCRKWDHRVLVISAGDCQWVLLRRRVDDRDRDMGVQVVVEVLVVGGCTNVRRRPRSRS